jgi:hypothetical protein
MRINTAQIAEKLQVDQACFVRISRTALGLLRTSKFQTSSKGMQERGYINSPLQIRNKTTPGNEIVSGIPTRASVVNLTVLRVALIGNSM